VIAQMGSPDMRLPIQLALTWPERKPCPAPALELTAFSGLTFADPDLTRFPALALAMRCAEHTDTADCAVMNAANEVAVHGFLEGRVKFPNIYALTERVTEKLSGRSADTLDAVLAADEEARRLCKQCLSSLS